MQRETKKLLEAGYVYYLDGFTGLRMSKLSRSYMLNMCHLLFINYTSINLLLKIKKKK